MKKLMLLFAVAGMVLFVACEDRTTTQTEEKPTEEPAGEDNPKVESLAGTRWVGEYWVFDDRKEAVVDGKHELIFTENTVTYIADSYRGAWTNEGTYTYDPPKIVLKVAEIDPATGAVEGNKLTIGVFATLDVVGPMEFKKLQP